MTTDLENVVISDVPTKHRYELRVDGGVAGLAVYRVDGDQVSFIHTEVNPALQGQGLASRLVKFALDDVKAKGMKPVPECSFVVDYMARHTDS